MGNRFSRRRDPANGAEAVAPEQKPAEEEPVATQQAEVPQIPEVVEAEKPAVVVEEPAAAVVAEPVVESVPEPEAPAAEAPLVDVTPEPAVVEEAPAPAAPVQVEPEPEPMVIVCELPAPVVLLEPMLEPEPEPEPEPIVEPEPVPEAVPEPEPEPVPTLEQEIFTQESIPEPLFSSAPLVDLGSLDLSPDPPSPADSPIPDEPEDLPGIVEAAVNSMPVPEESKESWESLEKPLEPESVDQLLCDVNSEVTDSGLLKHLDLRGSDLVNDLIPNDINIPDDIPIADMSGSSELM